MTLARALLLAFLVLASPLPAEANTSPPSRRPSLPFIANVGQADSQTCFHVQGAGPALGFRERDVIVATREHGPELSMSFPGSRPHPIVEPVSSLRGRVNFYIGSDPSRWQTAVPTYDVIAYRGLHDGIDLLWSSRQGRIESEWHVAPGADVSRIAVAYEGAEAVRIRNDGALVISTCQGDLIEEPPVAYEHVAGRRVVVPCAFERLGTNVVGFRLGDRDERHELIIDPVLDFSTYFGGDDDDVANAITVVGDDRDGRDCLIAGTTASLDFPLLFPRRSAAAGSTEAFVTRLDAGGDVLWSTYLGGAGSEEVRAITTHIGVIDGASVAIGGWTSSPDFPGTHFGPGGGASDGFVVFPNEATGAIVRSAVIGGSQADGVTALSATPVFYLALAGTTTSADFPTLGAGSDTSLNGSSDAFAAIMEASAPALRFSTYFGGSGEEDVSATLVFQSALMAIGGRTTSADLPDTGGAFQPTLHGVSDGFVAVLDLYGPETFVSRNSTRATFLGGSGEDAVLGITAALLGGAQHAAMVGWTTSSDFPLSVAYQDSLGGGRDGFVAALTPEVDVLAIGSYLGGPDDDELTAITARAEVDGGDLVVAGWSESATFPTVRAIQPDLSGGRDAVVARLEPNPAGLRLTESTFLGGSGEDAVRAVAIDPFNCIVLAGRTESTDFPVSDAAQTIQGGASDAWIARTCEHALPDEGAVDLTAVIDRLDEIHDQLRDHGDRLDALEAKLDMPPSHADILASADANGLAIAAVEAKLDASPGHADLLAQAEANALAIAALEAKMDASPGHSEILAQSAANAGAILALRARLDSVDGALDEGERLRIEALLDGKQCVPAIWLPEAAGGRQALARDIVATRIAQVRNSGDRSSNIRVAEGKLGAADRSIAAGDHVQGCQELSDALRALSRP